MRRGSFETKEIGAVTREKMKGNEIQEHNWRIQESVWLPDSNLLFLVSLIGAVTSLPRSPHYVETRQREGHALIKLYRASPRTEGEEIGDEESSFIHGEARCESM
ncbi:hypothetical protein S245_000697 [Arachis hypogaea]